MGYNSKYTGAEVDALLDKVAANDVISIDSALSTTSDNPVKNRVIAESLNLIRTELESNNELIEDLQNTKIDKEADDYYPKMAVGTADNLSGVEVVSSEFTTRQSGGGAIADGVARVQSIKGNSLVWNQSAKNGLSAFGLDGWSLNDGTINRLQYDSTLNEFAFSSQDSSRIYNRVEIKPTHKYYISFDLELVTPNSYSGDYIISYFAGVNTQLVLREELSQLINKKKQFNTIFTALYSNTYFFVGIYDAPLTSEDVQKISNIRLFDLTKMFGEGNEPSTIEEFYQRIPSGIDLNAYNEGEVISMNVDGIKSVGINQWDEEWENGNYRLSDGAKIDNDKQIRSKNFSKILPNTQYHITRPSEQNGYCLFYDKAFNILGNFTFYDNNTIINTPSNAAYMKFYMLDSYGSTYNNDICINISNADVNGKYYPYIEASEDLSIVGKYFPNGMRSAGTAHDEIRHNKATQKWEKVQRIGSVDFGTLNLYYISNNGGYFYGKLNGAKVPSLWSEVGNILAAQYNTTNANSIAATGATPFNMSMGIAPTGNIYFVNTAYTDAASFKAAMAGVILYYELAEPIVTELDEQDFNTDYLVWSGGTEEAIASKPSTPLKADITYGFNAVGIIKELKRRLEQMATQIAQMQTAISQIASINNEL